MRALDSFKNNIKKTEHTKRPENGCHIDKNMPEMIVKPKLELSSKIIDLTKHAEKRTEIPMIMP